MSKNDTPKNSEEKLDRFARTLLQSTILTDEEIEQTADAPRLWRQLQNRIADEKSRREQHRFFVWSWQSVTVGGFAVLLTASAAIWFFNVSKSEITAVRKDKTAVVSQTVFDPPEIKVAAPIQSTPVVRRKESAAKVEKKTSPPSKSNLFVSPGKERQSPAKNIEHSPKAESATEFIALSYSPAPESGQVVRVKVPRSMLVSLGVTTSVEKNSELVNAEVIVGDDGAARAIRFLANN